jgi:uncharacterized protein (DUF427 family)
MKATIDATVIADATDDEVVRIEGNWYFPPSSVVGSPLVDSPTPYTCPWKGVAQYHDVTVAAGVFSDAAWSYPHPEASAIERVGRDFSGYLAFDKAQVDVA